ncbi:unnamed protein product [Allacma fusca]|uniref:Methionine--tRNA ligase, mitochondrial n=1 Tax=Allacma fusca TaxID=39272 RepID=A0A8J2KAB1_9HEXA|nr:unnamed protein product [Allacma fusca]
MLSLVVRRLNLSGSWLNCKRVPRSISEEVHCRKYSFVTTPIFYVNSTPHIGHLYSALVADAYSRFEILRGERSRVFATGTDEHGMKIEKAAKEAGRDVKSHCDIISASFRRLSDEFNISYTDFIRTTEERHKTAVVHFWTELNARGHIYKQDYEGWYSVADETFLPDFHVLDAVGKDGQPIKVSAESGHPVEWCKEENYMFRLSKFIPDILRWIESEKPVYPAKFNTMVVNWLEEGFQDLSISRPSSRFTWGIPVPGDSSQVIYVWLDALINYLTVAGYPGNHQWPTTVQVVGKDILKFHAIYWPAVLLAHGLELPRKILCHSHWTIDNTKMSKSLGNVVDPFELKNKFSCEAVRYFLLSQGVPHSDGNYNEGKMVKMVNTALADTLGNLLSRCSSLALNPKLSWPSFAKTYTTVLSPEGQTLKTMLESLPNDVEASYADLNFYRGCENIQAVLRQANLYVQDVKPWELVKKSPDSPQLLAMMSLVLETLRVTGIMLWPIIPEISSTLLDRLNIPTSDRVWKQIRPFVWEDEFEERCLNPDKNMLFRRIKSN